MVDLAARHIVSLQGERLKLLVDAVTTLISTSHRRLEVVLNLLQRSRVLSRQ
jgi:hypothetical protein